MRLRHPILSVLTAALLGASAILGLSASAAAPAPQAMGAAEVYVDQVDTAFLPREIVVRQNEPTRFLVANRAPTRNHGFAIRGQGEQWETTVNAAGESTTLDATFARAGTYQFWCTFGSHRNQGMVGTLVVVPENEAPIPSTRVDLTEFAVQPLMAATVAGDTRFELRNVGGFAHDLVIAGQGVQVGSPVVAGGETVFWDATLLTPGTYEIYCSVIVGEFVHRDLGMTGILEVFPAPSGP